MVRTHMSKYISSRNTSTELYSWHLVVSSRWSCDWRFVWSGLGWELCLNWCCWFIGLSLSCFCQWFGLNKGKSTPFLLMLRCVNGIGLGLMKSIMVVVVDSECSCLWEIKGFWTWSWVVDLSWQSWCCVMTVGSLPSGWALSRSVVWCSGPCLVLAACFGL